MTQHLTIRALPQTRKEARTISQDCSLSSTQSLAHTHAHAHARAHTCTHTNIFKRLIKINWQHQGERGQGKGETYTQAWIRNCRGDDWCPGEAWLLRTQESAPLYVVGSRSTILEEWGSLSETQPEQESWIPSLSFEPPQSLKTRRSMCLFLNPKVSTESQQSELE